MKHYKTDCLDLHNMCNMELMANYDDNHFDLALVDPPYAIGADDKNNTDKKQSKKSATESKKYGDQKWDDNVPSEDYFKELFRVSKHQIIWGVNYYPYNLFSGGRIYWDKCVTMPTYSKGELAYCSKLNSVQSFKFAWHGMIQENMRDKETRIHPCQKPVKLYEWLLNNYAEKGQKILDTHLGSMSIAIACHYYGVHLTGCELDADYFKAGIERVEAETRQLTLF